MNFEIISIFLLGLGLNSLFLAEARRECIARLGKESTYCVCNNTYCDDLEKISKQIKGKVMVFETNKSGHRFKRTDLEFKSNFSQTKDTIVLNLNTNKKYQKIVGFGGAFTDSTGYNLNHLNQVLANSAINDYFSANGIEYSAVRLTIAGADFSPRGYSYDDNVTDDFELKSFKLQKEDLDYKIPYLKLAQKVSPHKIKLFGSPWSAPAWMKTNKKIQFGGSIIGHPGEKYYKAWANYFVKYLNEYKKNGLNLWGLTIQNEPGRAAGYNSMILNGTVERDFVKKDLGPALVKAGYGKDKLNVMLFDDNIGKSFIDDIDTSFKDPESAKYMTGIAYHCYSNGNKAAWSNLTKVHTMYPKLFILMTECCQSFGPNPTNKVKSLGSWTNAVNYARDVMRNMHNWVSGWVDWNMALDIYGRPHWTGGSADAPILVNISAQEYYKNPKFYVLGHFSKFLSPDSVRVELTANTTLSDADFASVAFVRPDGATVVIVYNFRNNDSNIEINDPFNGKLNTKISAQSIQSYIYWK